jgi:hypothetical protein
LAAVICGAGDIAMAISGIGFALATCGRDLVVLA